jgi:hypothetical protein
MGVKNRSKYAIKKFFITPLIMRLRGWLQELDEKGVAPPEVEFDNTYSWLQYAFYELSRDPTCSQKLMYCWGVLQGAALAKVLSINQVSVIEFGVAMGAGLKSLERISEIVESKTGVKIDVYGFDSGVGLPKPRDYRDQPNMWLEGQLPMDRTLLGQELKSSSLILGLVEETVHKFLKQGPAPIAFVSFDLDLYTSTKDALEVFDAGHAFVLPRVVCYFDDIMGHSYCDFTGERLAIQEFNESHELRKLSPIYGLRYWVPPSYRADMYWDCLYFAHFFDHVLYDKPDSIRKIVYADGKVGIRMPVASDWRDVDLFELANRKKVEGRVVYVDPSPEELRKR